MTHQVRVDIDQYLEDCPPWDIEIDPALLSEVSEEIERRFDSAEIYNQISTLACLLLRERGVEPREDDAND